MTNARMRFIDTGPPVVVIGRDDITASTAFRFDKNQPRDDDGKWTDGFPGVNPPDITSKPSGIKTGGSAKKVTPAVIYKKHDDGAVVGHSGSGQRMRWDAGRKKFVVEKEKSGSWVEESAHTKTSAYNEMKNPDKWFEPAETGTENKPSSPSLAPEPDLADTELPEEKAPEAPAIPEPEKVTSEETSQDGYPAPTPVPEVDPDWPFSFEPSQEPQMDYGHLVRSNDDAYANDPNHNYELKTLPVNTIVPSQENDYEEWGDGLENDMTGKPLAIKKDGNLYLMDGHHRTAKAGENGSVEAWVLDLDKPKAPQVPETTPVTNPAELDSLAPKTLTPDELWDGLVDRKPGDVLATGKLFGQDARMVVKKKNAGTDGPWIQTQMRSGTDGWDEWTSERTKSQFVKEFTNPSHEWKMADADATAPAVKKPTTWPDGWDDGNTLTPAQAVTMRDKLADWDGDREEALRNYTQHSDMLNGAIREDITHTSDGEDVSEWSGLIDGAMYELPDDLTVFRHADKKAFSVGNLDELKNLVGKTWTDKAYLSTSVTNFDELPVGAGRSATEIHIKIDLPKGSRGAYIADVGEYPEQDEFLIARNSSFTISDVEIKDGKAFITMKAHVPESTTNKTPEIPQQADAPEIESTPATPYVGPSVTDYAGAPKDVVDKVRAAYLADYLHTQRVEDRAAELRRTDKEKYSGYDAWDKSTQDARAELGWGPPVSDLDNALNALEKALPDYKVRDNIRRRLGVEATNERMLVVFAEKNNLGEVTPELKADLTQRAKDAFAGKKVAVRVTPKVVEYILNDGRLRSQFESGKSKGKNDIDMRASIEHLLFGVSDKPWQNPEKRPIYGYVAVDGIRPAGIGSAQLGDPSTDQLTQYGQVQVVLKDSVRSRTTAMFGDSLNNMNEGVPSPIDDPDWKSFTASRGGVTGKGLEGLDRSGDSAEFRAGSYAEAQIHGGVSVDDIEEIVFPINPTLTVKKQLEDAGIPYRVLTFKTAADGSDEERANALRIAQQDKALIESELKRLDEKIAELKAKGWEPTDYAKDRAKYEKQLKVINDALPLLEGTKTSPAKKVAAAKAKVAKATVPKQVEAPKIESTPAAAPKSTGGKLSAAEEQELTSLQADIADLYGQSGYWRMLEAEMTHKSGTGKILTKQDINDSMQADAELKKLRDAATPLAERALALRMKRDGDLFGEVEDVNADRWAKKAKPSSVMLPGNDPAKIDKIADSYRVNDKQTTEHNMSLRSDEPAQAALAWRSRMKRMINSQQIIQDAIVYRGAALTPDRIMQLRPGAVMIDPGSMSTDESKGSAEFYMNTRLGDLPGTLPTLFEIRVPKGTPAADVDYGEYVFDFETPMRIISTKRENGVVNVVVELVPPAEAKALYGTAKPAKPKASNAPTVNLNAGKKGSIGAKDAKRIYDINFAKNGIQPNSSPQEIFDKIERTAYYNNWSIMQVLEAIDAIKPGYKKTVLDWVKTPEGSAYAKQKTPTS